MSRNKLDRKWGMQRGNRVSWHHHSLSGKGTVLKPAVMNGSLEESYRILCDDGIERVIDIQNVKRIPTEAQLRKVTK